MVVVFDVSIKEDVWGDIDVQMGSDDNKVLS